jgi:hypothetical protein
LSDNGDEFLRGEPVPANDLVICGDQAHAASEESARLLRALGLDEPRQHVQGGDAGPDQGEHLRLAENPLDVWRGNCHQGFRGIFEEGDPLD